ncbi:hypothetical protein AOLI_G00322050 [Acnodon oligacanthus]
MTAGANSPSVKSSAAVTAPTHHGYATRRDSLNRPGAADGETVEIELHRPLLAKPHKAASQPVHPCLLA